MPRTEVMLIGALPAQAGFPGPGGPIPPSFRYPYTQPDFRMNRHTPIPSTWMVPQNLLRIGDKTNYDPHARASAGKPITSALAGVSPLFFGTLGADASTAAASAPQTLSPTGQPGAPVSSQQLYDEAAYWKGAWAWSAMSVTLLGAVMAGYHGYKRNRSNTGWALGWGLLGGMFPLITNGVALAQGFAKPHG